MSSGSFCRSPSRVHDDVPARSVEAGLQRGRLTVVADQEQRLQPASRRRPALPAARPSCRASHRRRRSARTHVRVRRQRPTHALDQVEQILFLVVHGNDDGDLRVSRAIGGVLPCCDDGGCADSITQTDTRAALGTKVSANAARLASAMPRSNQIACGKPVSKPTTRATARPQGHRDSHCTKACKSELQPRRASFSPTTADSQPPKAPPAQSSGQCTPTTERDTATARARCDHRASLRAERRTPARSCRRTQISWSHDLTETNRQVGPAR